MENLTKLKEIIKIAVGLQVIVLLTILGMLMLQEAELRDMEIKQWIQISNES